MKFLMLALAAVASIASVSMTASTAEAKTVYVTEKVCTGGESGTECQLVTYKVRPASGKVTVAGCQSPELDVTPCAPAANGVPAWLQAFNSWFGNRGPAVQPEAP